MNTISYQENTGEAYIVVCYYAHGMYKFKTSKANYTGIMGAIRNARVKDIEEITIITKEEYYKREV